MLGSSQNRSREKVIIQKVSFEEYEYDRNAEVQSILKDFEKLDFKKNPCDNPLDVINYNDGKEADPFDKIAKYYGRNKDVFIFISVLRDSEQTEKIIDIISKKCDDQDKEKFIKRMNLYLDRINKGENDAKEFLNSSESSDVFFNGPHTGENRNIHENLNINITKPGQILETDSFFRRMIKRIEEEKSEVKRAKIYSNGKRILTVEKNDKQQRNYNFTKYAVCAIEINWNAKDKFGKDVNCIVVLNVNSGQISIEKSTVDYNSVEPMEILELVKENEVVLIKDKVLHEEIRSY